MLRIAGRNPENVGFIPKKSQRRSIFHLMSETKPTIPVPVLSVAQVASLLGNPARWIALRELSKEPALPVYELGRRMGLTPAAASKQVALMLRLGVVTAVYGRLYALAPAFRPAPGTLEIDFGHCVVRLDQPLS